MKPAGSVTVFALSDVVFSKVPTEIVQRLLDPQHRNELAELLPYHAIGDKVLTSIELIGMNLPARLGTITSDFITINKQGHPVKISDVRVVVSNILANNGIIHIIDAVLMATS